MRVSNIMSANVVTVTPDCTVRQAVEIFHKRKISDLPVVDDNELCN